MGRTLHRIQSDRTGVRIRPAPGGTILQRVGQSIRIGVSDEIRTGLSRGTGGPFGPARQETLQ